MLDRAWGGAFRSRSERLPLERDRRATPRRSQRPGLESLESRLVMTASLAAIAPQELFLPRRASRSPWTAAEQPTPRTSASLRAIPTSAPRSHRDRSGQSTSRTRRAVSPAISHSTARSPSSSSTTCSNHHRQIRAVHLGRLLRRQGHHPNREQLLRQRRLRHAGRSPEPGRIREQRPARHALPRRARSAARV